MRSGLFILFLLQSLLGSCQQEEVPAQPGAYNMEEYLPLIAGKHIALVANHTSLVEGTHLVDTLLSGGVPAGQLLKVFAPEHGFRGEGAAGQLIEDGLDPLTGIPVVSLYGDHRKPLPEDLEGVEMVLFDLQDVGVRFYTYISTLHYVMEACAEQQVPMLVLDRPNPNGGYVDGPVLEPEYASFVGMHPIPVVYGLTIGELALMINGEGWLAGGIRCDLRVIPCSDFYHGKAYTLPVNPSPNLTNDHAIRLYPSTCFFEGTVISEGRGTPWPFEIYGHPDLKGNFRFTPVSIPGVATSPKFMEQTCYGEDLRGFEPQEGWNRLWLQWLLDAYEKFPQKEAFFTSYLERLAGTASLREQIEMGWDEEQIRESWQESLESYRAMSAPYMIYD